MRWLADESVDGAVVRRLRADGHDVESVDESSPGAPDEEVLTSAAGSGRVLLTADKDFGELVYRLGRAHAGVVLLRLAGLSSGDRAELVSQVVAGRGAELLGHFTVVGPDSVRIRTPPQNGAAGP